MMAKDVFPPSLSHSLPLCVSYPYMMRRHNLIGKEGIGEEGGTTASFEVFATTAQEEQEANDIAVELPHHFAESEK